MPTPRQVPADSLAADSVRVSALVPADKAPPLSPHLSNLELTLSSHLLLFSFAIVLLEALIIKLGNISEDGAVRLVTVTLILVSILYLTTAGYGSQQITAATGLLGTIAGYLLGRNSGRNSPPPT